jgi:hypothetical protein
VPVVVFSCCCVYGVELYQYQCSCWQLCGFLAMVWIPYWEKNMAPIQVKVFTLGRPNSNLGLAVFKGHISLFFMPVFIGQYHLNFRSQNIKFS